MVTAIGCRSYTKRRKTPKGKEGEVQDCTSTEERCKVKKRTSRPRCASQCRKILRKRSAGAYSTFVLLAQHTRKLVLSLVSKIRTTEILRLNGAIFRVTTKNGYLRKPKERCKRKLIQSPQKTDRNCSSNTRNRTVH